MASAGRRKRTDTEKIITGIKSKCGIALSVQSGGMIGWICSVTKKLWGKLRLKNAFVVASSVLGFVYSGAKTAPCIHE